MVDILTFYDEHPINERAIRAALAREGKTLRRLAPEDLFAHDQDHYGGLAAVDALAERARIGAKDQVLDICSGLGGPARYLAHRYRCTVTGLDVNRGRVAGAARLTAAVGLGARVRFVAADATALPFAEGSFDRAISQEAFLHIADKPALLAHCHRVLRPGGILAFTDWIAFSGLPDGERAQLGAGLAAEAIHGRRDYAALLAQAGFGPIEIDDLSALWRENLRGRLDMYRAKRDDTVRLFGAERHRAFMAVYETFVAAIEGGRLGGARFVARR